jgi:hypothetical protein
VAGYGTVDTPNSAPTPFNNNGSLAGNSLAEPLTLPGYVKGTGTLDNVTLTGTYAPGAGPASLSLGSVQYGGTLDIEIGGPTPGSDYDQLNHILGSGLAQLGGALNVSLLNGFMPQAGDMFDILTAAGGISGTFASSMLPALTGDLFWTIIYGPSLVELTVEAPTPVLPGDFNSDGVVDAGDYVLWRKGLDTAYTLADYDVWRAHFGESTGSNTGSSLRSATSVPEPGTLLLSLILAGHLCGCRRQWHYR